MQIQKNILLPELLEKLDEYVQKKFKYGSSFKEESVVTEEDD
jgi:hypothetical protein